MYTIQDIIFNKYEKIKPRQITNSELQLEIKQIKLELSQLKMEQQEIKEQMQTLKYKASEKSSLETKLEPEENTQEYMMVLTEVSIQRYLVKINIVINNELQLETIALFDTGADQNCIREGIIPTKYYNKTS
uniref:Retropepsins domain-containing protein n=1 Tax=Gossypium raimondii TaxID=29730 RepID=A0A0D2VAW9_GOSRA|nr:hypothetical protein B456_010G157900 [Gossypium raimondii]